MTLRRPKILLALGVALSVASAAHAQVPINKGKVAKKAPTATCSVVIDGGDGTTVVTIGKKTVIQCTDGSACDKDGTKNGSCTMAPNVCTAAEIAGCTAEPVSSIKLAAKAKKALITPPATPQTAVTAACGTAGSLVLPLGKKGTKASAFGKGKLIAKASITSGKGNVVAFAQCLPCVGEDCGGGPAPAVCPAREAAGLPKQLNLTVPPTGGDLDNGVSGDSHNFPVTSQSTLKFCLSNCDATTDSECDGLGSTGENTLNGPFFGAPLPLLANNVPVCVVNRYANASVNTSYNLATGQLGGGVVNLLSDVYVQTADPNGDNVCPRCTGNGIGQAGTCTAGARKGQACVTDGTIVVPASGGSPNYNLSTQCPPDTIKRAATLTIDLPLTTGESRKDGSKPCPGQTVDDSCGAGTCTFDCSATIPSKGGINQTCCSNQQTKPCFPTAADSPPNAIIRNGVAAIPLPAWPDPTYPKTVEGGKAAAVFCEAATGDSSVDILTGLPGPGSLILPYTTEVVASE
jgi:hypothetical protein